MMRNCYEHKITHVRSQKRGCENSRLHFVRIHSVVLVPRADSVERRWTKDYSPSNDTLDIDDVKHMLPWGTDAKEVYVEGGDVYVTLPEKAYLDEEMYMQTQNATRRRSSRNCLKIQG